MPLTNVLSAFEALRYSLPSIGGKALADFHALELALREAKAQPIEVTDAMCRAANEAYHNGHHGYLGAMHAALTAALTTKAAVRESPTTEPLGLSALEQGVIFEAMTCLLSNMQAHMERIHKGSGWPIYGPTGKHLGNIGYKDQQDLRNKLIALFAEPPTTPAPMLCGFKPHDGKGNPLLPGNKVRVLLRGDHLGPVVSYIALTASSWNWNWGNPPWSSDIIAYRPEP